MPEVATGAAELDCLDFIEELKIAQGPLVSVLIATSLHGALADAWVMRQPRATSVVEALLERWRRDGLPAYAQFDNGHSVPGGSPVCPQRGAREPAVPGSGGDPGVRAPREPGFQNAIEGFNSLWQGKVWRRHRFPDVATLQAGSARYIGAYRAKTAQRREAAPSRRACPRRFALKLDAPFAGTMIFLRRSNETSAVRVLRTAFPRGQTLGASSGALRSRFHSPAHSLLRAASTRSERSSAIARVTLPSCRQTIPRHTMTALITLELRHLGVRKLFY
jgi:hypothetical protein